MAKTKNPPVYTDATGQLVNGDTGEYIKPGDPLWKPEYSQVLADQPPAGKHYVYPNGGNHPETRYLEDNSAPWYKDPAFLGMIGVATLGFIPAVTAFQGLGSGAGAAGAGEGAATTSAALGAGSEGLSDAGTIAAAGGAVPATASVAGPAVAAGVPAVTTAASKFNWGKILPPLIGVGSNLIGGAIAANAATGAAQTQSDAAKYAADLTAKASADSLAFQKQQWADQQANMAPWLNYGRGAVTLLGDLMGVKPMPVSGGAAPATAPATGGPATLGNLYAPPTGGGPANPPGRIGMQATAAPRTMATMYSPTNTGAQPSPPPTAMDDPDRIVRIVWPDGMTHEVPNSQVPKYQSLGAEVVT